MKIIFEVFGHYFVVSSGKIQPPPDIGAILNAMQSAKGAAPQAGLVFAHHSGPWRCAQCGKILESNELGILTNTVGERICGLCYAERN